MGGQGRRAGCAKASTGPESRARRPLYRIFFGWSVLKDYRSPLWPKALVDDPTPLSNKFGWSVLYGAFSGTERRREGVAAPEKAIPVAVVPASVAAGVPEAESVEVSSAVAAVDG